ncbi:MAG: prepilin peptidase [Planctomycetes bacterium]|nr:prepilin peptidase [Planctomycetota bacterium]MCB9887878.1 prepilin peptidase [Planctomycetota bacterium]
MSTVVFEVGAALLGACVGSFLNVVIYRLPQEDPARRSLGGRSHCPHCGAQIRWFDNLPVLGWVLLRGRGRCCGQRIAFRYPLVELLTALLFLAVTLWSPWNLPITIDDLGGLHVDTARAVGYGLHLLFVSVLVACTFIDFDKQILPDAMTKPGMAIGVLAGIYPGIAGPISRDASTPYALRTLLASVVGLAVGAGVTWGIRWLGSRVFGKEAMGLGDVKFLGMIGAFLGWQGALLTLFLGCVVGAVVGGLAALRGGLGLRIPFGPYLALGALIALFAQDHVYVFLFDTWPEWQRRNPSSQFLLLGMAVLSLFALFVLVRRGRRAG